MYCIGKQKRLLRGVESEKFSCVVEITMTILETYKFLLLHCVPLLHTINGCSFKMKSSFIYGQCDWTYKEWQKHWNQYDGLLTAQNTKYSKYFKQTNLYIQEHHNSLKTFFF